MSPPLCTFPTCKQPNSVLCNRASCLRVHLLVTSCRFRVGLQPRFFVISPYASHAFCHIVARTCKQTDNSQTQSFAIAPAVYGFRSSFSYLSAPSRSIATPLSPLYRHASVISPLYRGLQSCFKHSLLQSRQLSTGPVIFQLSLRPFSVYSHAFVTSL